MRKPSRKISTGGFGSFGSETQVWDSGGSSRNLDNDLNIFPMKFAKTKTLIGRSNALSGSLEDQLDKLTVI